MADAISLPKSVRIGPFDFMIEDWDHRLAAAYFRFGECDKQNNVIRVCTNHPPQRVAEVLLHEILHAVWEVAAVDEKDEEKCVSGIAMVLAQVWRDNPAVVAFLSEMLARRA